MQSILMHLASTWKNLRIHAFTALAAIFIVRLFSVAINLKTHIGELWRPRLEELGLEALLIPAVLLPVLLLLQRSFSRLPGTLQWRYLLFHAWCYLLTAMNSNTINKRSYLYHLFDGQLDFEGISNLLVLDSFFEAPAIFWGLCFFGISYHLAKKFCKIAWLPVLWLLPFALVDFNQSNLMAVFFIASSVAAITCSHCNNGESARNLHLIQGGLFALILFYLNHSPIIYRATWLTGLILFPAVWVAGYWLIREYESSKNSAAISMTWLISFLSGAVLSQIINNAPLGNSLFNFWFLFASFNFAAGGIVVVAVCIGISCLAGRIDRRLQNPVFAMTSFIAIVFYLADAILLSENGMRISFAAIDWVWGLQDFSSIFKTAVSVIDVRTILFAAMIPIPVMLSARSARARESGGKRIFSGSFIYLIITAMVSLSGYEILSEHPHILQDSCRTFIASLPAPAFLAPEKPSLEELIEGFSKSNVAIFNRAQPQKPDNSSHPNIVLIMLESTHTRYLSLFGHHEQTWPEMEQLKERMEIFPFFFANFPESSNADFSVMSGLYPPDFLLLRQKPEFNRPTLIERLKNKGYECSMFFSGFIGDTGLASFYQPRRLARLYDAVSLPDSKRDDGWVWGIKEHVMVERIGDLLQQKSADRQKPFFVYYRMIFPHSPFDRVTDDQPHFSEEDYFEGSWLGRYKNCLLYQDKQIAKIIKKLAETGLEKNTLVVIVGDHGTMLGENGLHGHGWNLEPSLVNVPLIIIRPEATGFVKNYRPGCHADVLPSVLALAGIDDNTSFVQGTNLFTPETASRSIFISSLEHRAIIEDNHYFHFPIKNSADAMVYELCSDNDTAAIRQLTAWPAEDLWAKYHRTRQFLKLQKQFLSNIDHYARQSNF